MIGQDQKGSSRFLSNINFNCQMDPTLDPKTALLFPNMFFVNMLLILK